VDYKAIWDKPLIHFSDTAALTVGGLVLVIVIFIIGLLLSAWFSRMIGRRLIKTSMAPDNAAVLQKLTFFFFAILTALIALAMLNVPITALTFISGALAVGIGFGAQNIINNFISGWILMSERPVRIGDFIEIEDSRGMVEKIGNRSTRVRRIDGVHIMVPNSLLLERSVINWTLVDRNVRTSFTVGVAYGSAVREVEKLINQAMDENKDVLEDPAPAVAFSDFGDSALIFEVLFWVKVTGERELRMVRSDLRFRIDELFREHDITIAFPQRDLHIKTVMPLEIRQDSGQKPKQ
jgi:small-conductance mechanosensitive channel